MKTANTQNQNINWKKINTDNEAKLKALKQLINDWETQLPIHFYMIAINIIKNKEVSYK
jgi:hypothetical protein